MTSERRKYEREFEVSILFHPSAREGFLIKSKTTDKYKDPEAEDMFQGYAMACKANAGQLARYAPDRPMPNGFMHQLRHELDTHRMREAGVSAPDWFLEMVARAALKVAGGTPA